MAKKNIIKVDIKNQELVQTAFKDGLLPALKTNSITVKDNMIYMENQNTIYVMGFIDFCIIWYPSFEHNFKEELPKFLEKRALRPNDKTGELKVEIIEGLYQWTNPIFDMIKPPIIAKDTFMKQIQNDLKIDREYYDIVRKTTIEYVNSLPVSDRKDYIDRFCSIGILTEKDRLPLKYYATYSPEELEKMFKEVELEEVQKFEIVSQCFNEERIKEFRRDKKNKTNSRIIRYVNLLDCIRIIDMYLNKLLNTDEFSKTKVSKKDLLNLPYQMLFGILAEINNDLPENMKITSTDLVNQYGRNLNGDEIFNLFKYGYIEPKDFIDAYEINKSLKMVEDDGKVLDDEIIKGCYSSDLLIEMKRNSSITPEFVEKYLKMFDFENNPELFEQKSKELVDMLINISDGSDIREDILYFFNIGFCNLQITKNYISEAYMERRYLESEDIKLEEIQEYYRKGLITDESIVVYYSPEEIFELYKDGKVNGACLRIIKDVNFLTEELCDGNIAIEDFLGLYLYGNLSIVDFSDGLQLSEKEIDISSFINENVPFSKIKELFSNYMIDYATILRLYNQGIITEENVEEIKRAVSTKELFDELKKGNTYKVVTQREGMYVPSEKRPPVNREKADFSEELELISTILEQDIDEENCSLIKSYNSKGKATSLNNYRIFGSEELDGIIILQKSRKENAVYVLSALQMMYFLKGKKTSEGEFEIPNRMKDKAYLRTIEGVEVVDHTEYFARDLVEAASKISPKIAEKVKSDDGKYVSDVDFMIQIMREKYLSDKAKGRDE